MSKKEKKAVETLKDLASTIYYGDMNFIESDDLKIILKLIEKQQKEIEELKKDNNHQWEERCRLTFDIEKNFISKDKIREKIKELENVSCAECIESAEEDIKLLQELLEEE